MAFSEDEKLLLLNVKAVGQKVVKRLQQQSINSLAQLAKADPHDIT